jgi:beta-fructofuranosidase
MQEQMQSEQVLRDSLVTDPYRPRYHVVSMGGKCVPFDPNGALFWKGRYHLMLIVQPKTSYHCYAHISSNDLVHWRHHPIALEPGEIDTAIFSGGAFVDRDGIPTISYWGLSGKGGIFLATSSDDELNHWTKHPANPVIPMNKDGYDETPDGEPFAVADPSDIWIHEGRYYMLTGNLPVLRIFGREKDMDEHKGDTAYLFVSDDLAKWEYLHPFYTSRREWTEADEDCMCPDFFPLGDRHMLLFISHNHGCQYYIGRYENDRFYPETHGRMSWEDYHFFAPESIVDDQGRRIMWAWIRDLREEETIKESGWSGTLSLPRVLWLGDDKTLRMAPPVELEQLRYQAWSIDSLAVDADQEVELKEIAGRDLELYVEMESGDAAAYGVNVCCSPEGKERTTVFYDSEAKKLCIDTRNASLGEGSKSVEGGPFELAPEESLQLRIFIDQSVVEVFANERQAVMRRIYPTREDSVGVSVFSRGAAATVRSAQAWKMAPSNPW